MSDPTRGGYVRKKRSTQDSTPPMTADDSLLVEAYGPKAAALRKTAATMGEGLAKADSAESGVIAKVKSFFGRKKEPE